MIDIFNFDVFISTRSTWALSTFWVSSVSFWKSWVSFTSDILTRVNLTFCVFRIHLICLARESACFIFLLIILCHHRWWSFFRGLLLDFLHIHNLTRRRHHFSRLYLNLVNMEFLIVFVLAIMNNICSFKLVYNNSVLIQSRFFSWAWAVFINLSLRISDQSGVWLFLANNWWESTHWVSLF